MAKSEPKFKLGDRVEVGPVVQWRADEKHIGKVGVVETEPWFNKMKPTLTGHCYQVDFGRGDVANFFEEDLMLAEGIDYKITKLKAELAKLEKEKERVNMVSLPDHLPTTSAIFFPPTQLVIKVAKDKWHWYHVDKETMQFHSTSADKAVRAEIATALDGDKNYEVHRPTDL